MGVAECPRIETVVLALVLGVCLLAVADLEIMAQKRWYKNQSVRNRVNV